jgi:hypothetical protein
MFALIQILAIIAFIVSHGTHKVLFKLAFATIKAYRGMKI